MAHSWNMETMKKRKPSDWMETQLRSSFLNKLSSITDTTDGEQDDLPYDGDGGVTCKYNNNLDNLNNCTCIKNISHILNLSCSEDNNNKKAAASHEVHPQPEDDFGYYTGTTGTTGISAEMPGSEASFKKELPVGGFSKPDGKEHLTHSKMSDVLLRHFSKGELINTCQLIECETIPETSFTESIDETKNKLETCEHFKGPLTPEQSATKLEEYHLEMHEDVRTGGKNQNLLNESRFISERSISSTTKCGCRQENSQLIEYEDAHIFHNTKKQRDLIKKTVSSHELIHGATEIHYCLPDFSKVNSEMKVPRISENNTIEPTKSIPILLSKSATRNNILENKNCFDSVEVENQEDMRVPELLPQLEMWTQHADTKNRIDQLRFNPKILPQSDFPRPSFVVYSGGTGTSSEVFTARAPIAIQSTNDLSEPGLPCGTTASAFPAAGKVEAHCLNPSNLLPELTQGEKMSQILKEQTNQLKMKVEDFSKHMTQETFVLQDNYLALNQLKRYLDALERNYLTAREEHRNLQLQKYKDKSFNVGEFDPERKVEGEIFRLGMQLEDIQEQTRDNKCSLAPLLTSCESAAHSSYSLWESLVVSSITDPPEETTFLHKNNEGENTSQTSDVILQTNHQFSLEGEKCNPCPHIDSFHQKKNMGPKVFYPMLRDSLSQKCNADEESMKGNRNIQERKTGICSIFIQRKPTDLSDTNLSSDSEDISAHDSYGSQSKELMKRETESNKTFNTRSHRERKGFICRCPRESRHQYKLRNYQESVQSCALCRNKNCGSASYSRKRNSTQKAQTNKQPHELVNRLSESKKSARSKSAINIRNRNGNDFKANILNSTLDHAIQTANSLKKATERMVQAVSEDLAKVKIK